MIYERVESFRGSALDTKKMKIAGVSDFDQGKRIRR